jgi:ATP-dependent DNA helicase RecG
VSRGTVGGQCYIFAQPANDEGKERLRAFLRTTDGFALAEEDLKLRGSGEFFGSRQHGVGELAFGSLIADADLLSLARKDAFQLLSADARLAQPEHAGLHAVVWDRYGKTLNLVDVG